VNRILLDTNAYSAFMAGDDQVLDALAQAKTTLVSVVAIGELLAGFRGGSRHQANQQQLSSFLAKPTVRSLDVSRETAEIFGEVKDALRRAGTPIPINDVWLAAQAMEAGAVVVTYDENFARVPGLRLWDAL
jgi:tRNA(fMet)-specific endonuclease VapC